MFGERWPDVSFMVAVKCAVALPAPANQP